MKCFIVFSILFCFSVGISGADTSTAYTHEDRELTPLERETFDILKKKYPGEVLDTNLKTLNAIAASPEYLDHFLAKTYPDFAPFLDFHDFDERVLPPKDRYLKFCQAYLNIPNAEEITDDEQAVIHHIATSSWASEAAQRGKDKDPGLSGKPFRLGHVLAFRPQGREILERRKGKPAAFAFVLVTAQEHLDEDVRWIKSVFEKHGRSDGMFRVLLQDPMLFYRILYAFTTDATFLKCLYDPIDLDAERRKRLEERYRPSGSDSEQK